MVVVDLAVLQVNRNVVILLFVCPTHDLGNFRLAENYGEKPILHTIASEDVCE